MVLRRLPLVAGLLGLLVAACYSDDAPAGSGDEMVLYPTTKVLDPATLALASDAADPSTLRFTASNATLESVKEGDVLLGGIGPKTPSGVLRKVLTITKEGAGITFTTARAGLADAIERGHIKLPSTRLRKEGSRTQALHPLGDTAASSFDQDFTVGVSDVELAPGVTAGASLGFGLGVDLDLTVNSHKIAGKLVLSGNESATIDVHALLSSSFDKKVPIAVIDFPPIPIDVAGVPIVLTTELSVSVGVKGKSSVAVDWSATEKANMSVGIELGTDGLVPTLDGDATATADPAKISGDLSLRGYTELELEMAVNAPIADAAFHVGAQGYVKLDASTSGGPCGWSASRGVDGIYGVDASLLGITLAKVEDSKNLFDKPWGSGACSTDPLAVTPWAAVIGASDLDRRARVAVLSDQSVVVGVNRGDVTGFAARLTPGGTAVWQKGVGGTVGIANVTPAALPDGSSWLFGSYDTKPMLAHLDASGTRTTATVVDAETSPGTLMVASKDGGVLLAGQTLNGGSTYITWAAKVDGAGNLAWAKRYGAMGEPHAIAEANDGGVLLAGETVVGPGAALEVMRLSPSGEPIFARTYGEGRLYAVTAIASGGLAATGSTAAGAGAVVLRIADDGGLTWGFSYEDTSAEKAEYQGSAIVERTDGVLVAGRRGFSDTADFWAMQVGADGGLGWSRSYGGAKGDLVTGAARTSDDGALLIGETKSFGADVTHSLVLRLPPSGAFEVGAGAGLTTRNVEGAKKTIAGAATTQSPTPAPFTAAAGAAPAEAWPLSPSTATYTKL